MSSLLLKLFVKDYKNTNDPAVREKYGSLSGFVGIILNIILCAGKFFIGSVTGSLAITADAFNNLSDAGSSIVTLFGFKLSSKKADKDHPFGHGRYEYIAALVVAFLVIKTSIDLIGDAIGKIKEPTGVDFTIPAVVVLVLSILGKLWLAFFNKKLGKKINSPAMTAVVKDSIGDIIATTAALISLVGSKFTSFNLDGWLGLVVALFVMYAGYGILKDTISPLLGEPPEKEIVRDLVKFVTSKEQVMGIHDLVLHNYGANSIFGSIHVEVPADADFVEMHDMSDVIEFEVMQEFGIHLVVHLDPLVFNDERINELRHIAIQAIQSIDKRLSLHDFRVVDGPTHTNLIFDTVVPHDFKMKEEELNTAIMAEVRKEHPECFVVTNMEYSYLG